MDARALTSRPDNLSDGDAVFHVLDHLPEGVLIFDASLNITYFNQTAELVTGYLAEEVVGASYSEIFRVKEENSALHKALNLSESHMTWDEIIESKSGAKRTIEVSVSVTRQGGKDPDGGIAVFRDVTKTREIEEMKNEFVSIVSHELRTPLASIGGYCDLMLIGAAGDLAPEQESYLKTIQRNSENLARLINDLLDLSKIESKKMEMNMAMVNVVNLMEEVASDFQPLISQKEQHLVLEHEQELPNVYCDRDKIKQILTNLVGNAIKFTEPDGTIRISVVEEARVISFCVSDSGVGIDAEKRQMIFDKFQQLENPLTREKEGTGLGLAISKALVDRHNGRIWVESELGVGSQFYFTLPLKRTQVLAAQRQTGTLEFIRCWQNKKCAHGTCVMYDSDDPKCWTIVEGNECFESDVPFEERLKECSVCEVFKNNMRILEDSRGVILVAGDDLDQINLIGGTLDKEGYVSVRLQGPSRALPLAHVMKPHVIIVDASSQAMDSYAVLSMLRSSPETRDIPVILIKAKEAQDMRRGRRTQRSQIGAGSEAVHTLEKPVDRIHLLAQVENVLVKKRGRKERRRRGRRLVLVIDERDEIFNLIRLYLDERRFEVVQASGGLEGVELANQIFPDIVISSTRVPRSDDYSIVKLIKQGEGTRNIPVMMIAKMSDPERAEEAGLDEYLVRPLKEAGFLSAITSLCNKSFVESEKQIVVLDPDPDARGLVKSSLSRYGYDVRDLGDGKEAYEWIAEQEPDLIVMEVDAPGMDGFDLAQRLRDDKALSQIPVVIFTTRDLSNEEKEQLRVGNTVYEAKTDFSEERMLKTVRDLL